mgnify:CR=1 FL=1
MPSILSPPCVLTANGVKNAHRRPRKPRIPATFRRLGAIVVAALLIVGPALGGPEHELRRNVIAVIKSQIAAFQRDDRDMAFSYASPEVQSQFGTADVLQECLQFLSGVLFRNVRLGRSDDRIPRPSLFGQ